MRVYTRFLRPASSQAKSLVAGWPDILPYHVYETYIPFTTDNEVSIHYGWHYDEGEWWPDTVDTYALNYEYQPDYVYDSEMNLTYEAGEISPRAFDVEPALKLVIDSHQSGPYAESLLHDFPYRPGEGIRNIEDGIVYVGLTASGLTDAQQAWLDQHQAKDGEIPETEFFWHFEIFG
jgi:hypothetical protein